MSLFDEDDSDRFLDDVAAGRPTLYDQELAQHLDMLRRVVQETPVSREIVTDDEADIALLMSRVQYQPTISPRLLRVVLISVAIGLICILLFIVL